MSDVRRNVVFLAPLRSYLESLIHPSAQREALTAARHRAFIAPRLLGSVLALASFPIYLIARGTPSAIEMIILAWLVTPILTACFLSRTGRYESAHMLSSLALTGLVTAVAILTGGIASFAVIWLVVVPLDAALSASRRVVAIASSFALAAAGTLVLLGSPHASPAPGSTAHAAFAVLGILAAALYAANLALGAEASARTSSQLLCAEEDRYRLLARNMTDVITRHGRDGAVLFLSPAAEALFGCPVADLHGHGLFDRVLVTDRPAFLTALGDAAALGKGRSVEFRVRCDRTEADGQSAVHFVWIEMRCRPLEPTAAEAGSPAHREVVAVLRDVTERKRAQQDLLDIHAEVERADHRKSRFLATMSHELRTPLNAIIGFSEMLMKEQSLNLNADVRQEYAGLINDSGQHLLSVVNGVLDISKIETDSFTITPEPFAPGQVVDGCCDLLALRAREAAIHLEKRTAADLPELIADKRALRQILINLLSNAIRFSERGGAVTISARAEAAMIAFVVEDNGVGISDADLARVGEPYFQANASYERRHSGTGLGLSIVKGLVRLHGGDIEIQSRIGQGTRVTVRLPIDCERIRPSPPERVAGSADVLRLPRAASIGPVAHPPGKSEAAIDTLLSVIDTLVKKSA